MKSPKRRTLNRNNSGTDDLIAQFESGAGVSERSRKKLDELKEKDRNKQSDVHDKPMFKTASDVERILLDYIQPQEDNPRFLPVKFSKSQDPEAIATLTDCVVCEKGVLDNRLPKEHPRYDAVDEEIQQILELAETLRHNDLVHPMTVWRSNMSNYPIVAGHRRYYAIRYLYGGMVKVKCKVYLSKPDNVSILRHIENFSRSNLTPPDALASYIAAVKELEQLLGDALNDQRYVQICGHLGISRANYYRYEKLREYEALVIPLLERKIATSISELANTLNRIEKNSGVDEILSFLQKASDEGVLPDTTDATDYTIKNSVPVKVKENVTKGPGRTKKFITMPKVEVKNTNVIKRILTEDVTKLELGIDWDNVNYDNPEEVETLLKNIVEILIK